MTHRQRSRTLERRLLIAFLLSTILIVGYQVFYYAPRVREAQEQRRAELAARAPATGIDSTGVAESAEPPPALSPASDQEPVAGDRDEVESGSAPEGDALPAARRQHIRVVSVESPLYRLSFSSAGGELVSAQLLEYQTNGNPVDLVAADATAEQGILSIRLVGEDRQVRLSGVEFDAYLPGSSSPLADGRVIQVDETTGARELVFRASSSSGREIERVYTFSPDTYLVETRVRYAAADFPFARQIEWGMGEGLSATEENQKEDYDAFRGMVRLGDEYHKRKRDDFEEDFSGVVQWAALETKYFTAILLPEEPTGGEVTLAGEKEPTALTAALRLPAVERQGRVDHHIDVYIGPLDYDVLKQMGRGLEKTVDIGFEHFKIFQPVSRLILWSMKQLHHVIPNYGLVIILLSVVTKVLFYRLTHKSFKSMRDMQALQPKLQAIKEKYKDDRQKISQETMRLYKEAGVNPLGGCLPMLLQMPVFIALFSVLRNTIEVRRAGFFGWIDDLSQQDVLATLPFSLPIIGSAISVLPILMGASMFVQTKIGGSIAGPESGATQPKAFMYMMPIIFTVLFYKMPSGLVLYWLVNTVLSVGQQYYINKGAERDEREKKLNEESKDKSEANKIQKKQTRKAKVKKG